jgi:transcription-repair coupling factor (superfamily II helicase)
MIPTREELYPLEALLKAVTDGRKLVDVSGVELDLLAYLVVSAQRRLDRPVVLITPGASEARRLTADLRFFAGQDVAVTHVPAVDASPYGDLSPDRTQVMTLLAAQAALAWDQGGPFVVLSAGALARRVVPSDVLVAFSFLVAVGQDLDREACLRALADGGYHAVSTVEDPGTFAIRGGILDVFPPHLSRPVRVELWGDEVESMRFFDPDGQRTVADAGETLLIPPVREELLVGEYRARARRGIREAGILVDLPTRKLQPLIDDLDNGIPFMGIEGFRPAFYEQLAPMTDYLPKNAVVFVLDPMGTGDRLRNDWDRMTRGFEDCKAGHIAALPPERHALSPRQVVAALDGLIQVRAHTLQMVDELGAVEGPDDAIKFQVPQNHDLGHLLQQARGEREPLQPLAEAVRGWAADGARVVLCCHQETQLDRLERLLKGYGVAVGRGEGPPKAYLAPPGTDGAGAVLVRGQVSGGFRLLTHGFALITDEEIFGKKAPRRRARKKDDASPFLQSFRELEPGDHVVHADHGIGKYEGLTKLAVAGSEADFLVISFAGRDKLFLPVYKLGRLQKYAGGGKAPRVTKLGGTAWDKARSKARKSAEEDAVALLGLYAKRALAKGYAFTQPDDYYRTFEATFPFEETPDQARAIDEVLADMSRDRPMDRLLCGDVGFGKTEVALRAAFKSVVDGKQVAVLVPTTVLALQHYHTFKDRMAAYPVRVALLSRLVNAADQKEIIKDIKLGRVDIVIGTHRLLSKTIKYNDLGLLVLDEEHRFGVRHKERLKEVRTGLDVLAMTATPIPRTLQLSMSGLRDLSTITTPPTDRLSVKTFVCRTTDQVVRDAILRELGRGGRCILCTTACTASRTARRGSPAWCPRRASWWATARWTPRSSSR